MLDGLIDWFYGALTAITAWVSDWAFFAATESVQWFWDLMPQTIRDWLAADVFTTALAFFDDVRYFFPLYSTFAFIATVLSAVAAIRLIRWVAALIPTWIIGG